MSEYERMRADYERMRDAERDRILRDHPEHQRVQAEAAALRRALGAMDSLVALAICQELTTKAALEDAHRAAMDALSSSAGSALLEEVEGLRRERDELRAIPSGLFDALEATTTALEAAGLRSDLTKLARAVMRGEPEVLRAYLAESADLRARLERAEEKARLGWERAAEKDRAYGEALRERDEAREDAALARDGVVPQRLPYLSSPAEVRRAVEEEREEAIQLMRESFGWITTHAPNKDEVARALAECATAIRARGKESSLTAQMIDVLDQHSTPPRPPMAFFTQEQVAAFEAAQVAATQQAVKAETERIVQMLRARASGWGADTPVGHALEVAAADVLARGKE